MSSCLSFPLSGCFSGYGWSYLYDVAVGIIGVPLMLRFAFVKRSASYSRMDDPIAIFEVVSIVISYCQLKLLPSL